MSWPASKRLGGGEEHGAGGWAGLVSGFSVTVAAGLVCGARWWGLVTPRPQAALKARPRPGSWPGLCAPACRAPPSDRPAIFPGARGRPVGRCRPPPRVWTPLTPYPRPMVPPCAGQAGVRGLSRPPPARHCSSWPGARLRGEPQSAGRASFSARFQVRFQARFPARRLLSRRTSALDALLHPSSRCAGAQEHRSERRR